MPDSVSSGSVRTDRFTKRRDYADAGIERYWIIEPDPVPALTACRLEHGDYVDGGPVTGTFTTTEPFEVQFDLGAPA